MATPLPAASEWTGSTVTEGQFKTAQNNLRAYLADLLGTDGLNTTALASLGAMVNGTVALSGASTVVSTHRGKILLCSGTWTLALTAAATLGNGFACGVINIGTGTITIDPNSTETIDGVATISLGPGESTLIVCNGASWRSLFRGGTAKVSSNDAAAGYLNGKLVAGSGITFTENNDGSNESLTIASPSAASAVQSGANVGTGSGNFFRDKSGTTLNFRRLRVAEAGQAANISIVDLTISTSGDDVVIGVVRQSASGSCFLPQTKVLRVDHTWCPIEEISIGDVIADPLNGETRVLGIHRPRLNARWMWDIGPVLITGDHLLLDRHGAWRCVEPALYAKLREAEFIEIESGGEKTRIRSGAIPSRMIGMLCAGDVLYYDVSVSKLEMVYDIDPEQELIGLWTDSGRYIVQGHIVVDGFPQRP